MIICNQSEIESLTLKKNIDLKHLIQEKLLSIYWDE